MVFIRRVVGDSMSPTLKNGQIALCHQLGSFESGQVVVAFVDNREVIKRINKIENDKIYLTSDNLQHLHGRQYFAVITDTKIVGTVFWPRNL